MLAAMKYGGHHVFIQTQKQCLNARSYDPFLRIRFCFRKLEAGVQTVRFQGSFSW